MAGPINPRRAVLASLAKIRRDAKTIADLWQTPSTVIVPAPDGIGRVWEPRPDDQYPENQRLWWADLYSRAESLRQDAETLASFATAEYHKLPAEGKGNA